MKNLIPITLIAFLFVFSSCNLKEVINPDGTIVTVSTSTGTNNGTAGGSNTNVDPFIGTSTTPDAGSYLPMTNGSKWIYNETVIGGGSDTLSVTMGNEHITVKGRTFVKYIKNEYSVRTDIPEYYAYLNHVYFLRLSDDPASGLDDMPILKDNAAVNDTWTGTTDAGPLASAARFLGTMKEKNITLAVNGKNYTNVCHTRIVIQFGIPGNGFVDFDVQDYYFAKGIGIIKVTETFAGQTNVLQSLISYTIK